MEKNNLIILCGVFVSVVAIVCAAIIMGNPQIETSLITSNLNVNQGENFSITLMDHEGNKLANQTISVTLSNGVQTKDYNFTTDNTGTVNLPINLPAGNYTINGSFQGSDKFRNSSFGQQLNVIGNNDILSSSGSSGSSLTSSSNTNSNDLSSDWEWSEEHGDYVKRYTSSDGVLHIETSNGCKETHDPNTGRVQMFAPDGYLALDEYE